MGFDSKGLDDYIDVAQRIVEFRAKYPDGSLQPANVAQPFEIRQISGTDKNGKEQSGTFIIYTAAAYRNPDDPRPGIGCAYEVFPGRTPYTAGSELQNAETAAWGRAIVAALAADTRAGVASRQEVRNRQAERDTFETATPVRPGRKDGGNGNGSQPHGSDWSKWLAGAVSLAPNHASLDACAAAWKRSAELVAEGKLTKAQVVPLQDLLRKRMEELKGKPTVAAVLDPEDPWAVAIRELVDAGQAERLLDDARDQAGRTELSPERLALIEQAVEEAFPGITAMSAEKAAVEAKYPRAAA